MLVFAGLADKLQELNPSLLVLDILKKKSTSRALALVPGSKGWKTQQLAKELLTKNWDDPALEESSRAVVHTVAKNVYAMQTRGYTNAPKTDAVASLLADSCDPDLVSTWTCGIKAHVPAYSELICNNLLQHVYNDLIQQISCLFKPPIAASVTSDSDTLDQSALSSDEKAVLHYTIGYIARKLLRKFSRNKGNKASQFFLEVVRKWAEPNDVSPTGEEDCVLASEVTAWTAAQDRGGLTHCSPRFYHFMKAVELKVRPILNSKTLSSFAGQNIIPIVAGQVKACEDIKEKFRNLVHHNILDENLCEALLDELIVSWVATKANQALKKYLFDQRSNSTNEGKISRMGTPAMRKTLDKVVQ